MKSWVDSLAQTKDGLRLLQQEHAIIEATELICAIMKEDGVTRSQLAQRLGKTRGWVTQLLDGAANMTLRTAADIFTALGYELRLGACRLEEVVSSDEQTIRWSFPVEVPEGWQSWDLLPAIVKTPTDFLAV